MSSTKEMCQWGLQIRYLDKLQTAMVELGPVEQQEDKMYLFLEEKKNLNLT